MSNFNMVKAWEPRRPGTSKIEDIYRRYQQLVWNRLRRPDVEPESARGIHQDVFLIMDRVMQKMDETQEGEVLNSVPAMLTTIAKHAICNHLHARQRRPQFDAGVDLDALPSFEPDAEERVHEADCKRIVELILAKLPKDAAALIRWIDLGELTHEEVATILERPVETVKTQHRRARAKFRVLAERLYKKADIGGDL